MRAAFGVRDVRSGAPMTEKSVMIMQSMSKAFMGAAMLQLAEQGKVDFARRYLDYVPYFTMEDPRYADITLLHLFGHTSGLPFCLEGGFFEEFLTPSYGPDASQQMVRNLAEGVTLLQDPGGSDFLYSDIGYDILAELVRLHVGRAVRGLCAAAHPLAAADEGFDDALPRGGPGDARGAAHL